MHRSKGERSAGIFIIDPTKVVRVAIQNAASVAALPITTEAMVAEVPKKRRCRRHASGRRHGWHGLLSPTVQRSKEKQRPGGDAGRRARRRTTSGGTFRSMK
jgi:hypothetical protein